MRKLTIAISDGCETDVMHVAVAEQAPERGASLVATAQDAPGGFHVAVHMDGDDAGTVALLTAVFLEHPGLLPRVLGSVAREGGKSCQLM